MPTSTPTRATPADFEKLVDALDPLFVGRRKILSLMMLALVAKCHIFMLSKPGTAKSMLVTELTKRIDGARLFALLFDKFEAKDAFFGPPSIPSLTQGIRRREFEGYGPTADLVFADEIWKGSEAASNALLEFVNERIFLDGNTKRPIPLWTMFAASNELPEPSNNNLAAIYDRFELRVWVDQVEDPEEMMRLLTLPEPEENPQPVLDWALVADAHAQAMALPFAEGTLQALIDIQVKLRPLGVRQSGRRQKRAVRIAQANAWLAGADEVRIEHLDFLMYYLWDQPDQRQDVAVTVLEVAAPGRAEALGLSDQVADILSQLRPALEMPDGDDKSKQMLDLDRKLRKTANRAAELEATLTGLALSEVNETWGHLVNAYHRLQVDGFSLDPEDVLDIAAKARAGKYADL